MSTSNVVISGIENLKEIFRDFPEKGYRKPLNAAFMKAAQPVKRAMIRNLPPNLSSLGKAIKAKSARASKGEPSLAVGVFSSGGKVFVNSRGIAWNPWVVAYWANYGTLSYRTTLHKFATARKRKTAGYNGGIKPGLFIERGWDQSQDEALKVFEQSVDEEIMKFFEKAAAK